MHSLLFNIFLSGHRQQKISAQSTSRTFLDLSTEIYLEVLKYLDIPSKFFLMLSTKHFYSLLYPTIKKHLGKKLCGECKRYRQHGAFPQLINLTPEKALLTNGFKRWFESFRQVRENRQRIDKRKELMIYYELTHLSPPSHSQESLQSAKHIQRTLPWGGWVSSQSSYLFEYWGFCGWTWHGTSMVVGQWIFQCECLRCSTDVSEAQNRCCWCDPDDSRHLLLTLFWHETWFSDWLSVRDLARILFMTRVFPYGSETCWVGRRKNSCDQNEKWEESELPSW